MGKASKWIRNLLLGKKEENFKQIDTFCPENKTANTVNGSSSSSSNKMVVKRRWSFRKLTSGRSTGKVVAHKISKSFDSDDSPKLQIQGLFYTQSPRFRPTAAEFVKKAATKIQASFRSYLARRALHALRGLVKLQALVRGHLVRKQTTATLRGMHALMSIQVRARIKRIKMAEEVNPLEIQQPPQHTEIPSFKGQMTQQKQNQDSKKNMIMEEMLEVMRSRSGPLDVKSRKYDSMAYYSRSQSISKRENQLKKENHNNNNNKPRTILSAPNSPEKYYRDMIEYLNPPTTDHDTLLSASQRHIVAPRKSWSSSPSYMNKTESSRAKTRSSSEPRQRPKQGTKQQNNSLKQNMFSNSARYDHWVVNSLKESNRDSFGSYTLTTSDDSYYS